MVRLLLPLTMVTFSTLASPMQVMYRQAQARDYSESVSRAEVLDSSMVSSVSSWVML